MVEASVPGIVRALRVLSGLLTKGEAFALENGVDPAEMLDLRLAPDMFPLIRQVQTATDIATRGCARLAGAEMPSFPDTETSFAELQQRITRAIAYIEGLPAEAIDASRDRAMSMQAGTHELKFTGRSHLLAFILPNVYFHVTIAYGLLRQRGVPIGKIDFLGGMDAFQ